MHFARIATMCTTPIQYNVRILFVKPKTAQQPRACVSRIFFIYARLTFKMCTILLIHNAHQKNPHHRESLCTKCNKVIKLITHCLCADIRVDLNVVLKRKIVYSGGCGGGATNCAKIYFRDYIYERTNIY